MRVVGNDPFGVKKIDAAETDGLLGTHNSLAYRVAEIERHFHHRERWFGAAATASGETHVADRVSGGINPFTLTAGNDDFGAWVQILGSSDTPVTTGAEYFDSHNYIVTATNSTNPFIIQLAAGESSELADRIANGEFTESMYISSSNLNDSGVSSIASPRIAAGTKVWARCACIGSSGSTLSMYIGLHEYEG